MVRKRDDGILKDAVEKWETDGANPGPAAGNVTGRKAALSDVVYVVGANWKQRYMIPDETTGGHQFMDKQFNRMSGKWENYGNKNDWDTMCATCHTTGYRLLKYDPANPKDQKWAFSELGIGCEVCHGPGAKHVKSRAKKDIWNFAGKTPAEQTRVCGYCHIRLENEMYKSAQGNPREDFPAPKVGRSFHPSDDWAKWYPEHVIIPGVQPEDKIDAEYKGDLKGMFLIDNVSKAAGNYEAGKHHEEYQEFLQSKHYKGGRMSCTTCHSPHAGKDRTKKDPRATCAQCHDASYTVEKYMPGTGKTADNLYLRTHTFYGGQNRPGGPTASGMPEYYKDKKK
jgi:predicted CXXCH cytochrome family protein